MIKYSEYDLKLAKKDGEGVGFAAGFALGLGLCLTIVMLF